MSMMSEYMYFKVLHSRSAISCVPRTLFAFLQNTMTIPTWPSTFCGWVAI